MNEEKMSVFEEVRNEIQTSTLAIVSLVAGILGLSIAPGLGSIVAIITGHLAKREIAESNGRLDGDSMATIGLILGYMSIGVIVVACCCVIGLAVAIFVPVASNSGAFVPIR